MKVLHVSSGNLYGGVETMIAALARYRDDCPALTQRFALCFDGRIADDLRAADAVPEILGAVRLSRPWSVAAARGRLTALIAREAFDVVLLHSPWALAVFGRSVRRSGAALGVWQHHPVKRTGLFSTMDGRSAPDLIVCNSHYTAASARRHFPAVPTETVYCPVSQAESLEGQDRTAIRQELDTEPGATVLIQASRMESWKGHEAHLRALAGIRDVPGWVAWIAGGAQRPAEETYLNGLRSLATELGISDRIRFIGERTDIPRVLAAADIYCQPNSGAEPFGIVFVEALGAGIPCVTSDLGGAAEIVDRGCGELIRPGDLRGLTEALRRLIEDPERRRRLGKGGRERARSLCEPGERIAQLDRFLRRVLDGSGPAASARTSRQIKES